MRKFIIILLSVMLGLAPSCDDDFRTDQLPIVYVFIQLNVNDLRYLDLQTKGFVYLQGGLRGILLYKNPANEYIAFERACPDDYPAECAIVKMDESLFNINEPCCLSTYDLDGNPSGGPATTPLRRYFTFLEGNLLTIQSEGF